MPGETVGITPAKKFSLVKFDKSLKCNLHHDTMQGKMVCQDTTLLAAFLETKMEANVNSQSKNGGNSRKWNIAKLRIIPMFKIAKEI